MYNFFNFFFQIYFISSSNLIEILLSNKKYFNLTETSKNRKRRSRRLQSPSLERDLRASEVEASQGNETIIETLKSFDNDSSVRDKSTILIDPTKNGIVMQVWTQRVTDNTNKEMAEVEKDMDCS